MAPVRSTTLPDGGFALPLVIMITTIIMFLGTAFLTLADTEQKIAENTVAEIQALYTADAGVEKALALLEQKPVDESITVWYSVYQDDLQNMAVGGGMVNVTVQEKGGLIEIISQGQKNKGKKTVIAKVAPPAWEYGLLGEGSSLSLEGSNNVNADIAYRGNIEIKGSRTVTAHRVIVDGNLTIGATLSPKDPPGIMHVSGSVEVQGSGGITGQWNYDVGPGSTPIPGTPADFGAVYISPPPEVDLKGYQENADWIGPRDGDVITELTSESDNELLYFEGDVDLQAAKGKGDKGDGTIRYQGIKVLVVSGNVTIRDDILPAGTDDALLIIAGGTVTVSGNKTVNALMISEGGITMGGSATLQGSFWSSTITSNGAVDISYDEDMVELIRATGLVKEYSYRLVSWQEQYPVF